MVILPGSELLTRVVRVVIGWFFFVLRARTDDSTQLARHTQTHRRIMQRDQFKSFEHLLLPRKKESKRFGR
jgi:hypothetical protein